MYQPRNFRLFVLAAFIILGSSLLTGFPFSKDAARSQAAETTAAERGLWNLQHNAYGQSLPIKQLLPMLASKVWEPEWKAKIDPNDPDSIRKIAFERYGFSEALVENEGAPLQFVATKQGWAQTCMLCHGGHVPITGESKIGMPNTELDMQTLYEDVTKATGLKGPFPILFGMSRGRTNAFVFSLELLRRRNEDLSARKEPLPMGDYSDYDLDPPAWWNLKKKTALYVDAGVKGDFSRAIMQFTMGEPSGEKIKSWESDFKDILAYLNSIEAPKYPLPIDQKLAANGQQVFNKTCAGCHGTYGPNDKDAGKYPNKVIPTEVIGTDSLRLTKLTKEFRDYYKKTWFGKSGEQGYEYPTGYVAPPLTGIWASAPYFHNGSVPTVYGVLTAEARPKYFRRVGAIKDYDAKNLGLKVEELSAPAPKDAPAEVRRRVVDTTLPGLSNQGHSFGFKLSEQEKRQVIEYLKTI